MLALLSATPDVKLSRSTGFFDRYDHSSLPSKLFSYRHLQDPVNYFEIAVDIKNLI